VWEFLTYLYITESDITAIECKQKQVLHIMESKETSVSDSDFARLLELEKKIEYLEDELTQANGKLMSLEELLMLAENVLCHCVCPDLKEQISLLLSNVQRFMPRCGRNDSPAISRFRFVDVATQCDGKCIFGPVIVH